MRITGYFCLFWLSISACFATTLEDIRPHTPNSQSWSEQWFYYLNDPNVGYFKISVQTYLTPEITDQKERAYVHFVYAPIGGTKTTVDKYFDDVQLEGDPTTGKFRFFVPGKVNVNNQSISLALDDLNFKLDFIGEHKRYWQGKNPGKNPYGWIGDLPSVNTKYFIYTMGTESNYEFSMGGLNHKGEGITYLDKGWFDSNKSQGFVFIGAFTPEQQLMMTGGYSKDFPFELWVGRYFSEDQDVLLKPSMVGFSVKKESDACQGYFRIEIKKLGKKVIAEAQSNLSDFYITDMPSMKVFGAEKPIMKSMYATIKLKVYKWGKLVEEADFPQGLLEFSGDEMCSALEY